ncbi:MAG: Kynureninase [Anaerolineales bacterium]|nr:Kynureninase [Anaerolineales bacterium]
MSTFSPSRSHALELDQQDPLASFRERFVISDSELLYMDGNSLGRLPKAAVERTRQVVETEWGQDLIRGWNKGWWEAPQRVGDKIGQLTGAAPGQVIVSDTTSLNLYKLVMAALMHQPNRKRIISDAFNFPSDLYILQGCANVFGNRHEIIRVGSQDEGLTPDLNALESAINEDTALVTLSHVFFKSGYLYDMQHITDLAHRKGALVLWDLCHSVGALPIQLDACNADLAIGCTYKYLNGGPGAPAFLYVNKNIQQKMVSPIWGWWGQNKPFDFGLDYEPAPGVNHFLVGSQPILSLLMMESALDPTLEAGLDSIRQKSVALTGYLIHLADEILSPLGFRLGSPRAADRRGSHVSLRHADAYRINRALIEELNVIPDFRAPDNIRLGLAPLYTTFVEVWDTIDRIRRVIEEKRHEKYPQTRLTVT